MAASCKQWQGVPQTLSATFVLSGRPFPLPYLTLPSYPRCNLAVIGSQPSWQPHGDRRQNLPVNPPLLTLTLALTLPSNPHPKLTVVAVSPCCPQSGCKALFHRYLIQRSRPQSSISLHFRRHFPGLCLLIRCYQADLTGPMLVGNFHLSRSWP